MDNKKSKEDLINEFIDDLNMDKKPRAYKTGNYEGEDEELFETIRAVKRSCNSTESKGNVRTFIKKQRLKLALVAASIMIVFSAMSGLLQLPGTSESINIVHAIQKAYENLQSYTGTTEITGFSNGEVEYFETVDIKFKRDWKFKGIHRFDGVEVSYHSNGTRLVKEFPNMIEVENVFPDKALWRYHIGTPIWELSGSQDFIQLENEMILGRDTIVIKYNYEHGEFNKIWIDSETKLPLKKEISTGDGSRRLVMEFKDLEINPEIDDSVFEFDLTQTDKNVRYFNQTTSIEELKARGFVEVDAILSAVSQGFEVFTVGDLTEDLTYDYVIRLKELRGNSFLDVFYSSNPEEFRYSEGTTLGKLKEGYVEINEKAINVMDTYIGESTILRWTTENEEFFIVTNLDKNEVSETIEEIASDKIEYVSIEEIKDEISPVYTKDNH